MTEKERQRKSGTRVMMIEEDRRRKQTIAKQALVTGSRFEFFF